MKKGNQLVLKAKWGSHRIEFSNRLPEIFKELDKKKTRREIHQELNISFSYNLFCKHLNNALKQKSSPSSNPVVSGREATIKAGVSHGGFSIPSITISEGDDE